jgi:hypothetical protein
MDILTTPIEIRDMIDEELIKEFPRDFPFPDLESLLYFSRKEVLMNGRVVAAAFMRLTSEAILIQAPDLPRASRAKVLMALTGEMDRELERFGLDDVHVFISEPEVAKTVTFYTKRLGFIKVSGVPLMRRLHGEERTARS